MNSRTGWPQICYVVLGIAALSASIHFGNRADETEKGMRKHAAGMEQGRLNETEHPRDARGGFEQAVIEPADTPFPDVPARLPGYQDGVSYLLATKNDYTLEYGDESWDNTAVYVIDKFQQKYDKSGEPKYTDIHIPDRINGLSVYGFYTEKNKGAFQGHKEIKKVHLGREMEYIFKDEFKGCTGLEQVDMPEKLKTISCRAFQNCKSLSSVSLPDSLAEIEDDAFAGCSRMTSVTLPKNLRSMGEGALGKNIQKIRFITKNPSVAKGLIETRWWDNQIEQGKPVMIGDTLISCGGWSGTVKVSSRRIKKIMKGAFKQNIISDLQIDGYAYLDSLKSETLQTVKLTNIRNLKKTFLTGCKNLWRLELGEGIENIPYSCFREGIGLKEVWITSENPVCWDKEIYKRHKKTIDLGEKSSLDFFVGDWQNETLKDIYIYSRKPHPSIIVAGIPKKVTLHVPEATVNQYKKYVKCRVVALKYF